MVRVGRTLAHAGLTAQQNGGRAGKLVIVESPAKARTVGRFLGKGYTVKASIGHVRDLLRSRLSVDVENGFTPTYRVPKEKKEVVRELKALAAQAEEVYLATDPDREGEAIAWHLMEAASIDPGVARRVTFHEITEPAIQEAFAHPRPIDMNLVNAQQARRILDRLVGYQISPLLWQKVRNRLSAGRVQSVALRLIVEREREIQAFVPQEYWTIAAEFLPDGLQNTFIARLARVDEQEPELPNEEIVRPLLADMERAQYEISRIKRGERRRKPAAPFITSTLQQEASRRLGFTAKRTMALAQALYEGVDIGEGGSTGLITYMRTDSTNVSELAQAEARRYIADRFGHDFLPAEPPRYKTRAVSAQEAHEAIRPTSIFREPERVKPYLEPAMFRLYELIWKRFVASQMEAALYDTLQVEISGKGPLHTYLLRASGSLLKFPGFLVVYEEARDEDAQQEEENVRIPARISEGQRQHLQRLIPEQHFTQPPPRYTEASLIQTLEENGIGRPSTYAPILSIIQQRGYVERVERRLVPTETGMLVSDLLVQHFPEIMDVGFTAQMEENLDRIANGEADWVQVLREFYAPFSQKVARAHQEMPESRAEPEKVGRACPKCGHDLVIRYGRFGKFISCSNFPTCRHTEPFLERIGVRCPKDGGEIVERKSRRGRVFYGCENYPSCDFTSWKKPLPAPCPSCDGLLVLLNKSQAQCISCQEIFDLEELVEVTD
uniref:DNA topoisomerase 1 n=1 Tax=uncultured Chloroflexota bacterium TaxID=166587 RepID=H5SLA0_9CHLR|nr:DNA topoisomerase I [uncultured Chloroflexota bacterium]